jgi:hypothetical protein
MFEQNEYTEKIRIKPKRLKWIKDHKGKKTAAAFLDEILDEYIKPNLFKKRGK